MNSGLNILFSNGGCTWNIYRNILSDSLSINDSIIGLIFGINWSFNDFFSYNWSLNNFLFYYWLWNNFFFNNWLRNDFFSYNWFWNNFLSLSYDWSSIKDLTFIILCGFECLLKFCWGLLLWSVNLNFRELSWLYKSS